MYAMVIDAKSIAFYFILFQIQKSTGAVVITRYVGYVIIRCGLFLCFFSSSSCNAFAKWLCRGKYRLPTAPPDGEKPLYLHISAGTHVNTLSSGVCDALFHKRIT